jgi:hypothetical protein
MSEASAVTAVGQSSGTARDVFPVAEAGVPAGVDMGAAMLALRRLNFYRDLLRLGFEGTIWPDRSSRTLRTERLALGIEHPELDLVAVWAARCGDGRVSIPFIEHLLVRARDIAAHFLPLDETHTLASQLALIDEALLAIAPEGRPADDLPRLGEVFIDEREAVRLCGVGGVVDRLLGQCEDRLLGWIGRIGLS